MGRETDAELIAASRRGETGAFGLIVERYQRAVCAVAFAAVRDRVLAEDIAQDTFVMAWSKLGSLKDVERLPAWLCGIARNLARTRRRRLDRERPSDSLELAGGSTPYEALDERQTEVAVADALARVPEKFREPLLLFYCEERSAKDVARMLGTTDQAVHQRLSRGRQYLASDEQLFEHAAQRAVRPRRDLAAAVVAAIAVGVGASSRVEASPRPRGTTAMMKIGAVVIAAAGLAGTTAYVAHRSAAESHAATAHDSTPAMAIAGPSLMELHDVAHGGHGSSTPSAHAPALPGTNNPWHVADSYDKLLPVSPACADVASHLTDLSMSNSMVADTGAHHFALATSMVKTHFEQACAQGWSPEYIACAKAAADPFSMHFDCKKYAPEDNAALEKNSFMINQDPNATFAAEKDSDCASVARHLAAMHFANAEAAKHQVPAEFRDDIKDGFGKAQTAIAEMVDAACTSEPWSDARRQCIANATSVAALDSCD